MVNKSVHNTDAFTAAVIVAAHRGVKECERLLALAHDDTVYGGSFSRAQMAHALRSAGMRCREYVELDESIPERYWVAARCSCWVLVHVYCPCPEEHLIWGIVDACKDHPPQVLYLPFVDQDALAIPQGEVRWTGEGILLADRWVDPTHEERGMPSLQR